ncbi:MAG: pectin esterase [Bacteroidales bacterium]|nr:pectin esterase [Bacteroidales bacterium]
MKKAALLFLSVLVFLTVSGQTKPSPSVVTVAKDGSGDFTTIQEAVDALRSFRPEGRATIRVRNGVYEEKVVVPSHKTEISIIGESRDSTILIWHDHANMSDGKGGTIGTFGTYTLKVEGPGFICEDMTIVNDAMTFYNPRWHISHKDIYNVGQAVAVHIDADRVIFRNCALKGFQDTLFTGNPEGREFFDNCWIEGTVDFIFGPATVWFRQCHLHALSDGYYTAASTPEGRYGYIFDACTFTAAEGIGKLWLGRPWRPYAQVILKDCLIDAPVDPQGWNDWGDPANHRTARFWEYSCSGKGAGRSGRVAWSKKLSNGRAHRITKDKVFTRPADIWETYR